MRVMWMGMAMSIAAAVASSAQAGDWREAVKERLALYGHRNWIVVADSAYPAQSRDGIETVVADAGQLEVVGGVLEMLDGAKHVRPNVFLDKELRFVPEKDAPGVTEYWTQLSKLLKKREVAALPHEQLIGKLDEAAKTFRVLIIKTRMTVPYTTVFLQLDCAYWSAEQEQRLREAIK